MNRPFGVTIMAILAVVSGFGHLLRGLVVFGIAGGAALALGLANPAAGSIAGILAVSLGILVLMVAVLDFWFAWGAWHLKPWAWGWGVFTQVSSLILSLLAVVGWGTFRTQGVHILVAVGILLYLMSPGVKQAFGKS